MIINFMYTTCSDGVCLPTTAKLARVHKLLGGRVGRDIRILSVTIDPEVDTPNALKEYSNRFGDKRGWFYLTGDYDDIDRLRHKLGVYDLDPVIDADKSQHSGLLTLGNDRTNRWAALPALMNVVELTQAIVRITRE